MAALAHLGLGFASKQTAPKVPIVILVIAPCLIDLLAAVFSLLQFEKTSQIVLSHSLIMAAVWSIMSGLIILLIYRDLRSGIVIGILVFSHWIIDFITWPMTAIYPNATGIPVFLNTSVLIGLGLYKSLIGAIIFEVGITSFGIFLYVKYKLKEKRPQPRAILKTPDLS